MKKIMILTIMMLLPATIVAQSGYTLVGGFNMSTFGGDDVDEADNLMGFKIGIQQTIANGLIATYSFTQRGCEFSDNYYSGEMKLNYLSASIVKPFSMGPGFDFLAGGDIGYFLGGESESCFDYGYDGYGNNCTSVDIDSDDLDSSFDFGLEIGARYKVNNQIGIVGTYYLGLKNVLDKDMDATNRSFQIYATYAL